MSYYAACCCSRYVALVPCKGQVGTTYTTTSTVWSTNFGITDFEGVWLVEVGENRWCAEFQAAETAGTEPTGISISGVSGCGDAACGDPEYFLFDPCSEGECLFQMAATNADWGALLGLPEPAPGLPYDLSGVWKFVPSVANEECCGLVKPCNPFCGEISPTPLVDPDFCDASCPDCNVPDGQIKLIDSSFTLGTFEEVEGSCGSAPECQQCQSDPCDKPYLKVTGTTRFKISCNEEIAGKVENGAAFLEINDSHTGKVELDVAVEWEHYLNANAIRMDPEDWSAGTSICDRVYNKHAVTESYIRNITFNQNQIEVLSSTTNSNGVVANTQIYETEGEFKLFQQFPNNNTEGLSIECGDIYKRQYVCSDSICRSVIPPEDICESPGCYATFGNKLNGELGVDLVSTTTLDASGGPYTCTGEVREKTPTFSVWSMLLNPNAYACCCDHNYFLTEDCFLATGDGRHLGWNWINIYNLLALNVFGPPGSPTVALDCEDGVFETLGNLALIKADGGKAVIDFDGNVQDFVEWTGDRCLLDPDLNIYGPCFDGLSNPVINCNRDLGETSWEWNATQTVSFRPPGYLTGFFLRSVTWQLLQTETVLGIECVDSLP